MKGISHKFNFRLWFEEQMNDRGYTLKTLAQSLNMETKKLGRLMNNTDEWTTRESKKVAEAFELEWWDDFVMPLRRKGLKNCITLDEADTILGTVGERLGTVAQVA